MTTASAPARASAQVSSASGQGSGSAVETINAGTACTDGRPVSWGQAGPGAADRLALRVVHPCCQQSDPLGFALDPLGDDARADLPGKRRQGAHEREPGRILVQPADESSGEFQKVRPQVDHVRKAGVARSSVVDRQPYPTG